MKPRFAALCCAALLALTASGCSALLNREYASSSVHVEYPVSEDASVLQAENYPELVNAFLYLIGEHQDTGVIRLSNYTDDVSTDVEAARREVCTEDPLGAYAVEDLQTVTTRVVSYYEVTVTIQYARSAEEVAAIVPVTGSTAIKQTLSAAMESFSEQCAVRVSYFTGDTAAMEQLARQTYLDTPLAALAEPDIQVTLYPNQGTSRIVEFSLTWPEDTEALDMRRSELESHALTLLERLGEEADTLTVEQLCAALRETASYVPTGGTTAYDALVRGRANDQGFALALRLLCQLADLEATVAEGTLLDAPHFWLIVYTQEGYRHLDPTAEEPLYATDDAFHAAGYAWEESRYPDCIDYAAQAPQETGESEETALETTAAGVGVAGILDSVAQNFWEN